MNIPKNINQSINYQPNSIVSQTIVKKTTGSITLFAFDQNQALSEHTTPYDALVMIVDGEAEITLSGIKHSVKAGEMLFMPANSPHALSAPQAFKMLLIMIGS